MIGFVRTYPNFITNLAPRFRWQLLHIFIQTEIHGTFILLFTNFYRCHFNGAVFGVIIYWLSIFGSILRYWVLPWTVNCFHILVSIVRFHLSQTLDFPSFSVEYSVMSFVSNSSLWNANTVTCLPMSIICIRDTTISSIHTFMSGPLMNILTYFPYIRSPLTNILRAYCDILSVFFIISRALVDMYSWVHVLICVRILKFLLVSLKIKFMFYPAGFPGLFAVFKDERRTRKSLKAFFLQPKL